MLSIGVKKRAFMYIVTRSQDEKEVRLDSSLALSYESRHELESENR